MRICNLSILKDDVSEIQQSDFIRASMATPKQRLKAFEYSVKKEDSEDDDYIPIHLINQTHVDSGKKM